MFSDDLQKAFEAHRKLLDAHFEIWRTVTLDQSLPDSTVLFAQGCLQRTQEMVQQCSDINFLDIANQADKPLNGTSTETLEGGRKKKSLKNAKKPAGNEYGPTTGRSDTSVPQPIPVIRDPSGLFTIDSNPADPEVLLKEAEKREKLSTNNAKRKLTTEPATSIEKAPTPTENLVSEPPSTKRKKTNHNAANQQPSSVADNFDEGFEHRVALRLKEKDEAIKSKKDKKRKRESDVSMQEIDVSVDNVTPLKTGKGNKRRKTKDANQENVYSNAAPENSSSTSSLKTAKRKQGAMNNGVVPAGKTNKSVQPQKPNKKKQKKVK